MKRRIVLALIATAIAGVVQLVWFSSVFDVRTVPVFGAKRTTATQIRTAAGIEIGMPVARVNIERATQAIERIPQVYSAEVRRGLPHSIVITIHERVAIAVTASGRSWSLVDREGVVFQRVATPPKNLTVVVAYTEYMRGIGARMAVGMPDWLRARVARVTVYAPEDIRLQLRDGKRVRWGNEQRAARKAEVLKVLLAIRAKTYDVSAPDAPATSTKAS